MLELLGHIQKELEVKAADEKILPENFHNIMRTAALVERKASAASA